MNSAANSILARGRDKPKSDGVEVVELPAIVIEPAGQRTSSLFQNR